MGLQRYRQKRDFKKTAEPRGGGVPAGSGTLKYLIQKHDATRLHYDLRLQVGDVLASWAVPKGPSVDPSHKRLAVHVEDHPLEYGEFEGTIPKGEYGGGTVMLWDTGTWTPKPGEDPARAIKRGKLEFELRGKRLRGGWKLVRLAGTRSGSDDSKDNWLLIKTDDDHARTPGESVVTEHVTSVKTGRTMEEIAKSTAVWSSSSTRRNDEKPKKRPDHRSGNSHPARPRARSRKSARMARGAAEAPAAAGDAVDPSAVDGARRAPLPREFYPQLCTLTDEAPPGPAWLHEIKYDGYRIIAIKDGRNVRLLTRSGADWTRKFEPVARAVAALDANTAVLDGELTVLDDHGHPSFQRLQNALKAGSSDRMVYYVFDLPYLDGYSLLDARLIDRKTLLKPLVPGDAAGMVRYSDHVVGSGQAVRKNACELALEGIICKRADAPYTQARSKSWLKVKCSRRQEFVIVGWSKPSGARSHFGSLLLGTYDPQGELHYAGRVGTGFNDETLADIKRKLDDRRIEATPLSETLTRAETRGVTWVKPELVGEIEFTEWTDDGRLRHPSFQGLREDKKAALVRPEVPVPVEEVAESASKRPARSARRARSASGGESKEAPMPARSRNTADSDSLVAGVRITHPDRVLYPGAGLTKLDLARYYEAVATRMLPFLVGRPLSTVRCPEGIAGQCFFQKHVRETFSNGPVKSIRVREQDGEEANYIAVDSVEGLVSLVQFGVLEIHPWGSTRDHIDQPDTLTFDLDPGEGVSFDELRRATLEVRKHLEALGLACFLKTTGGKGLHVVVPLTPDLAWEPVKEFCSAFAKSLAAQQPDRFIAVSTKARRKGLIFLDYLRNSRGATSIAPFSTRARAGAPIAVPFDWKELDALDTLVTFHAADVLDRLRRQKRDPWAAFEKSRTSLAKVLRRAGLDPRPASTPAALMNGSSGLHDGPSREKRTSQGVKPMPKAWSAKDERQYEHVKSSERAQGRSTKRAKEIAARTVNKQRSKDGRAKSPGRKAGR
ncbi:MAG: DNA ligase [Phycisphaerales bacterium]|nr:DNA ligase [Phycisphaerales bacterium]